MEKQWRSLDEYHRGPDQREERVAEGKHKNAVLDVLDSKAVDAPASRRDFLKLFGFSFATAAIASSCEKPVQKAIPYLIKPEEITPGKASYYASTYFDGTEYASILVKTRDGRPIKIEGNPESPISRGGTSARIQASVLNLYDDARYKEPAIEGRPGTWEEVDRHVMERLAQGGRTVILTPTVIGPSTREVLHLFMQKYPGSQWIQYDEVSASGIRQAHQDLFGSRVIPSYRFDRCSLVLSFGADFLGTWLSPVEFARDYASTRDPGSGTMSRHIQVEASMSMTGANADERIPLAPAESALVMAAIYNRLAAHTGQPGISAPPTSFEVDALVEELLDNKGRSLVLSGSNDPSIQKMVAGINYMLDNYGATLDLVRSLQVKQGDDTELLNFLKDLENGKVDNLIMAGVNPAYSLGEKASIAKAKFTLYLGDGLNETGEASQVLCPIHHYLESWGDAEAVSGSYSLQQPCIHPLFNTRAFQDSLLIWAGEDIKFEDLLRETWMNRIAPPAMKGSRDWWVRTLQSGFYQEEGESPVSAGVYTAPQISIDPVQSGLSLSLYTSVALNDGRYGNNPWLQELPDPVSKVCWDNYLAVSPADADELGLEDEMVVKFKGLEMPVIVQPGQARGTISMALGYGRSVAGKVGDGLGVSGFPLVSLAGGHRIYETDGIELQKTSGTYPIARTQTHHHMEGRPIVRETTMEEYRQDPHAGNHFHLEAESHHQTLYPEAKFDGYHWGLVVDQNKCTGCNNCIVSCISENNVAVVGKEEVRKRRIMHWIRIDRYYSEEPENPKVFQQAVMCQHCDNAPCENVCPVSATMHSNEGLNQVAYVRCIGTKYCINNCPYRVRRFNWYKYVKNDKFDFNQNSDLSRLQLNPDVTVRERGVVEKCTFCVQRIQEKKMEAKLEGRELADGEVQPACVQSCPTNALVFGNMNDPGSGVSRLKKNERNYHLLEQLHTLPSVGYLTRVRNVPAPEGASEDHGHGHEHGGEQPQGHGA